MNWVTSQVRVEGWHVDRGSNGGSSHPAIVVLSTVAGNNTSSGVVHCMQ